MTERRPSSKAALRQGLLQQRLQLSPAAQKTAAEKICQLFFQQVKVPAGAVVAGYWPVRGEVDGLPILRELLRRKHLCALPHVAGEGRPLEFRSWNDSTQMVMGKYDIPEPAAGEVIVPDIILVPLAAFDKTGHRLGYGGGFYDRTLAALKKEKHVLAIGFGYEMQGCDTLPVDENDVRLDMVITDKNVYRFGDNRL